MGVMRQVTHSPGHPFTVADLATMPDDGRRYELIDGVLLVSPTPGWSHQEMAAALYRVLYAQCPPDLRVMLAPFGVRTASDTEVQPDVLVARYEDLTEACLPVAPLLAAEVLSPSTKLHDRNTKMAHYERLGVASYWLLDPVGTGAVELHELGPAGRYELRATVVGEDVLAVERPFPVDLCPARLLDGLRPAGA